MYWRKGAGKYAKGTLTHFRYLLSANFVPGKRDRNFNFLFPIVRFKDLYLRLLQLIQGFPGKVAGKESACNAGDPSSIPGLGRSPGEGIGYPLQYFYLENPHGQRSLVGYSPWGHKESDKTALLSTAQYLKRG